MSEIRGCNITKKYGNQTALEDVSFCIPMNKISVILGPSGAGKSTLLRILAGLDQDFSGTMEGIEKPIAMIFQSDALFPHTKVFDNIAYGLSKLGYQQEEISSMVHETAKMLHIEPLLDRYPVSLSGGEAQRVGIARAIVRKPKLLLLDEPFSSLDERLKEELYEELKTIKNQFSITMVLVSHDQKEALSLGEHLILLNQGKLVETGSSKELYENPHIFFSAEFLGVPKMNALHGTIQDSKLYVGKGVDVVIGIRPEWIMIGIGAIKGEISNISYEGNQYLITVFTKIGSLHFQSQVEYAVGEKLTIWIDWEKALVYQNGIRIFTKFDEILY